MAVFGRYVPRGFRIAPRRHVRSDLLILKRHVERDLAIEVAPGVPNCGTKWQFFGHFSSVCTLVYTAAFESVRLTSIDRP